MKMIRISGTFALVLLLVPLSGCIGGDDKVDSSVTGDSIEQGLPPKKFSFEPEAIAPSGDANRNKEVKKRESQPTDPVYCIPFRCGDQIQWSMSYKVEGLPPLAEDETLGEAWYSAWIGKPDTGQDDGFIWERISGGESAASNGTMEGETPKQSRYKDKYTAMLISLETVQDSRPEIRLMVATGLKQNDEDSVAFNFTAPFKSSFADAKVEEADGKVNLTVSALTLPEVEGDFDVFIKNPDGTTYLGTLKYDSAQVAYVFYGQPDPKLFTKYQFFISIESPDEETKEEYGGFKMLVSKFKT